MTGLPERDVASNFPAGHSTDSVEKDTVSTDSKQKTAQAKSSSKGSLWSSFFISNFSIFESHLNSSSGVKKETKARNHGWVATVKKVVAGGSMRRLQERFLGTSRANMSSSTSDIWLLGTCYKVSPDEASSGDNPDSDLAAFLQDFSSRIWITYRKGFGGIGDSRFTSDVSWGCMIRSSQMLVAQALLFHHLGRSWRKPKEKPYDRKYIEILHLFGDSEACTFSIHNLLQSGRGYGLAAGLWVGPYAMCRTWETLARANREHVDHDQGKESLPMVVYVVSGDEDGERGGAPIVCVDVAARLCSDFSNSQLTWAPILLLVPLVLGLEKVNPRYIPLLWDTFTFPQSIGIMGGKPGASTYIVGVQDDKALYLDPHEVQPVAEIKRDNLEADISSYHSSVVRNLPLEQIDPSLAIGFYCRDRDDFEDFCSRASKLGERSNGAPLFTVAQSLKSTRSFHHHDPMVDRLDGDGGNGNGTDEAFDDCGAQSGEDEWQLL